MTARPSPWPAFRLAASITAVAVGALLGRMLAGRLGLWPPIPLPAAIGGPLAATLFQYLWRRRKR
jgi:hypothetical protein